MGDKDPNDFTSKQVRKVTRETAAARSADSPGKPDAPMTKREADHLRLLSEQAGEPFQEGLTRAEAERRIDELQKRTGEKP